MLSSNFINLWWDLSSAVNLNEISYESINTVKEKRDSFLVDMEKEVRDIVEPMFYCSFNTMKNRYQLKIQIPDMKLVKYLEDPEKLFYDFMIKRTDNLVLGIPYYLDIVAECFGLYSKLPYASKITLKCYKDLVQHLREYTAKNKSETKNRVNQMAINLNQRGSLVLHASADESSVVCMNGIHGVLYENSCIVPVDNIIFAYPFSSIESSFFIVAKDNFKKIRDSSSIINSDKNLMDIIYQPWDKNTFNKIDKNNLKLIRDTVNVFKKVKTANLNDYEVSNLAILFRDPRLLELISDEELKNKVVNEL